MPPGAGSIAFIGYNSDDPDSLAFVALEDIAPGTVIFFTNNAWDGMAFGTSDGTVTLTLTGGMTAGSVVRLESLDTATPTTSSGGIARSGNFNLINANEVVYAYIGSAASPTFLSAIANDTFNAIDGFLTNTGLTQGIDAIALGSIDADADIAAYNGVRSGQAVFAAYRTIINTPANWISQDDTGSQAGDGTAPDLPFSSTPFTAAGTLAIDDVSHSEGTGGTTDFTFTVTRSGGSDGAVSASWTLVAPGGIGGASGSDFTGAASGTVDFLNGETTKTITVTVNGDPTFEPNETFTIALSGATGGATITDGSGAGLIDDDDDGATTGDDFINGTPGNDTIHGLAGDDFIRGNAGDDQLYGDDDNDYIRGNAGTNLMDGGAGYDRANYFTAPAGVTVDLRLQGSAQNTGWGIDTLLNFEHVSGTIYTDTLYGDEGHNWLWALGPTDGVTATNDNLYGFGGNDLLQVGTGDHILDGGSGTDAAGFGVPGDVIERIPDPMFSFENGIYIDLFAQGFAQDTGQGMMTLTGIENASGSVLNDVLIGDNSANVLAGDAGHDQLFGFGGNDTIYGDGAIGADTGTAGASGPITVFTADQGGGVDFYDVDGKLVFLFGGQDLYDVEGILLTPEISNDPEDPYYKYVVGGTDYFFYVGSSIISDGVGGGSDFLDGGTGDDSLYGGGGHDNLAGGTGASSGNDMLDGGDGDDMLRGGAGDDTIIGGAGFDRARYFEPGLVAGVTVDLNIVGVAQNTGRGMDTLSGIEHLSGTQFADILTGDGGDNWLWGTPATAGGPPSGANDDTIDGRGGNDLITVGIGNHNLTGGTGTDTLRFTENTGGPEAGLTVSLAAAGAQTTGNGNWTLSGFENLSGGTGDDHLIGDGNSNVLAGEGGNDTLEGGAGNDTLLGDGSIDVDTHDTGFSGPIVQTSDIGANGNDTLIGGGGRDVMRGGGGDDRLVLDAPTLSMSVFDGGAGTDTLELRNWSTAYAAPNGPTTLVRLFENTTTSVERIDFNSQSGTALTAQIVLGQVAGAGLTGVVGGAGVDTMIFVVTSPGNYTMPTLTRTNWSTPTLGTAGDIVVLVGSTTGPVFNYTLNASAGHSGTEALIGAAGNDILNGSNGYEFLDGRGGVNQLYGGGAEDVLAISNITPNIAPGMPGATTNYTGAGSLYDGGLGFDYLSVGGFVSFQGTLVSIEGIHLQRAVVSTAVELASQTAAQLSISGAAIAGLPSNLAFAGEGFVSISLASGINFNGSAFVFDPGAEIFFNVTGSGVADTMVGTASHDRLLGNGGDDNLSGGDGDDYITGSAGNDVIEGGGGFDRAGYFVSTGGVGVTVDLNIVGVAQDTIGQGMDTLSGIENLSGSTFADTLTGDGGANWLWGSTAFFNGVTSTTNDDVIDGQGGDDLITVGIGDHTLEGGADNDTLRFTENNADPEAGLTISLAEASPQITGNGTWTISGFENLSGGKGDDHLTGDDNANRLTGAGGSDTLAGGGGDDLLSGDGSWDIDTHGTGYSGSAGLGFSLEMTGNDSLDGGAGDDTALFTFEAGAGTLTIEPDSGDLLVRRDAETVARISFDSGTVTVTGLNSGAHLGTDTLVGIEHLNFAIDGSPPVVVNLADGVVVDGYVAGGTVFIDEDGNELLDPGEISTTTDSNGNFTLPAVPGHTGPLVMYGGTDIATGLANLLTFRAAEGSTVVSPLTTLVESLVDQGFVGDAEAAVKAALGIAPGVDLSTFDPFANPGDPNALSVLKAAASVVVLVTEGAELGGGDDETQLSIFVELAAQIGDAPGEIDLTDGEVIFGILENVVFSPDLEAEADAIAAAAATIEAATTPEQVAAAQTAALPNDAPVAEIAAPGLAPAGGEVDVNSTEEGLQLYPAVVGLYGGGHVVIWETVPGQVHFQVFAADGSTVGSETTFGGTNADASALGTGFVIAWTRYDGPGGSSEVYAQRYDPTGGELGGEIHVNTTTVDYQQAAAVAQLLDGGFLVTWSQSFGPNEGIYGQRFDATGTPVEGEFTVTTSLDAPPHAAGLTDGGWVVTWIDNSGVGQVYLQRFDADGDAVGGAMAVATEASDGRLMENVAALENGGWVVVWLHIVDGPGFIDPYDVHARVYDAAGTPGAEFTVNQTDLESQFYTPGVAGLEGGGFVISWNAPDAEYTGTLARRYDSAGAPITDEFVVNQVTAGDQGSTAVGALAGGGFAIAWQTPDAEDSGIAQQVYGPGYNAVEQVSLDLRGTLSVSDVDAGDGTIEVTIAVGYGIIQANAGSTGVTLDGEDSDTLTVTGTLAQIQDFLSLASSGTLSYFADTDTPPAQTTLTLTVDDNGHTGDGGPLQDSDSATIVIDGTDEPPAIGNLVFFDANNNGVFDMGDSGIDGVTVWLRDFDNQLLATAVTSGGGLYNFGGLSPGDYIVEINTGSPALAGMVSVPGGSLDPNDDVDNDDNGVVYGPFGISTNTLISLTIGGEPISEDGDANSNLTIDFGFQTAPDPTVDLDGPGGGTGYTAATYVEGGAGVAIADIDRVLTSYNGQLTRITITITDFKPGDTISVSGGFPGENQVFFNDGGGVWRIEGTGSIADFQGALSALRYSSTSSDPGFDLADLQRTISFVAYDGVHSSAPATTVVNIDSVESLTLGNFVFRDLDGNGLFDGLDSGIDGVTVQLLDATATNVLGSTTTASGGLYSFTNLSAGDYVVRVLGSSLPAGYSSSPGAPDPDNNVDNDDNGTPNGADFESGVITLTEGDEPTNDGDADADTNLTLDFGFVAPAGPTVDLNGAGDGIDYTGSFTEEGALSPIGTDIAVTAPALPITSATITITDPLADDHLNLLPGGPVTITVSGAQGGTTLTLIGTGTPADWAAALSLVRYSSTSQNPDSYGNDAGRTITVVVSDGASTSGEAIAAIAVNGVSDDPVVTNLYTDVVTWTEDLGEVLLDLGGNATVSDIDNLNFGGGSLEVAVFINPADEDLIFITNTANVELTGGDVIVDSVPIGTATYGGGDPLVVTFNDDATPARVQTLLHAIAYGNLGGDDPTGGSRTIVYLLKDGDGGTSTGTTTVNVTPVNDEPAVDQGVADHHSDEDAAVSYTFAADAFGDPEGDPLDYSATLSNGSPLPDWLSFDSGTRTFTGPPPADFNGTLSIKVVASDGQYTASDIFDLVIDPVADIMADSETTDEDMAVNVLVLGNDEFEGTPEITAYTPGLHGSVTLDDNGTPETDDDFLVYTPGADFNGSDSFTYQVTSGGVTEQATVSVTIDPVADIMDDVATTDEETAVNVPVLDNDEFEGTPEITAYTPGLYGSVVLNDNATPGTDDDFLVYTPGTDFNGIDSFTYQVTSGGVTEQATVTVTVDPVDDAPDLDTSVTERFYVENATAFVVDSGVTLFDPDGPDLAGIVVAIAAGYASGEDSLGFDSALATSFGISGAFNPATGRLDLSGPASAAEYQQVLRTVTYANASDTPSTADRQIEFSALPASTLYYSGTGHFYEFVSDPEINWTDSLAGAAARDVFGVDGYLVTITSSGEQGFVAGHWPTWNWMGASDAAVEGDWRWAAGPEAGLQFWQGGSGGVAISGRYNNWGPGEPANSFGTENYGSLRPDGTWNALPDSGTPFGIPMAGYVVEYGGMAGDPVVDFTGSVTIHVEAVNDAPTVAIDPHNGVAVDGETQVSTATAGDQRFTAVAALPGGGHVVVWMSDGQDGGGFGIYGQRYDTFGSPVSGEFQINVTSAGDQRLPAAAALSGGGFVVAWMSFNQDEAGTNGIYVQRYNASGGVQNGETRVNTTTADNQENPSITGLADGGFVVTWQSLNQDGSSWGVYARRFDANIIAQGGEVQINTTTADVQANPVVAAVAGGYVIAWTSHAQDGSGNGVYARRYDGAGNALSGEVRVNTETDDSQSLPAIAALAGGGYVITWTSDNQDGDGQGVYAQRFSAGGVAQGLEVRVNTIAAGDQTNSAVAALSDGGYVVTWQSLNQDESGGYGVYAQAYDSAGNAIGSETLVNTFTAGDQRDPAVAGLDGNGYVIAWRSDGQDGSGDGVYAQRFDYAFQAVEQVALDLKGTITIADIDVGAGSITVTVAADYGIIDADAGTTGVGLSGEGSGMLVVTGTLAQVQDFLALASSSLLSYVADTDDPPASAELSVTINDNGNTGTPGPRSATATETIHIVAVNDAPTLADFGPSTTFAEHVVNAGPQLLDASVVFADGEGNFAGGTVTLGGGLAEDALGIRNEGILSGQIGVSGSDVSYGSVLIGTFSGGNGTTPLTITLNGNATSAAVDALIQNLTYANSSNMPTASRTLVLNVTDSDGADLGPGGRSILVNVTPVNDEPTLGATGASPVHIEDTAAVDLFSLVTASTIETTQTFTSLTLTVSNVTNGISEILRFDGSDVALVAGSLTSATNGLSVIVTVSGSTATVRFSGASLSAAQVQTLVDGLTYRNISQAPTDANRVVTITQLVDSGADTAPDDNSLAPNLVATVDVEPVNDAPTSTLLANDNRSYMEGSGPVTLDTGPVGGNATIADVDSANFAGGSLTLTFAAPLAEDNLLIVNTAIVTTSGNIVSVNGTAIGTFSGGASGAPLIISFNTDATPAAVQLFVRAIGYTNSGGDVPTGGLRTIGWALNDGDGNANGGNPNLSFNSRVNVISVNDPPVGADVTVEIDEDEVYVFVTADFPIVTDPEGNVPPSGVRIHSSPANGTLFFDPDGNGPITAFEASPGLTISSADIAAGKFYYVPAQHGNGDDFDSFEFSVVDSAGAPDADPKSFTFDVVPVNDPALITGTSTGSVTEAGGVANGTAGTPTASANLAATDVDNSADAWQAVTIATASDEGYGTFTVTADGVWTYTLDDTDLLVQALNGTDTLTDTFDVLTQDGTTQQVTITINAQNDAAAITGTSIGDVTEAGGVANGNAGDATASGNLGATDIDNPADTWQAVTIATASDEGHGTFTLTADGVWTYTLDDTDLLVQALNGTDTLTDTFDVLTQDGTTQQVTITINAQNDAAAITGTSIGDVAEAGGVANGNAGDATASGNLGATDIDNPADTWQAVTIATASDEGYGTFTVTTDGVWTYTLDDTDPDVQALNGLATLTDTFDVLTQDGTTQQVTITINAQNDAAAITGTSTGSVTEAGGIANGNAGTPTASANLAATDVDNPADTWQAVTIATASDEGHGTFTLTADGVWTYTLDDTDPDVQALNGLATLTDTFDVLTQDGTAQTVTITINAQNDGGAAQDDAVTTNEATVLNGNVFSDNGSGVDIDVDDPAPAVVAVNGSAVAVGSQITLNSGATLKLNADGTFTYNPNNQFNFTPAPGSGAANLSTPDSFFYTLSGGDTAMVNVSITGIDTNDTLIGTAGADTLLGGVGTDTITGLAGNDFIDGGTGADTMTGGADNDTYVVDNAADRVIEADGGGTDKVYALTSYVLTAGSRIETLTVTDHGATTAINLFGNEFSNNIYGNNGVNVLNGGGGNDAMVGYGGNDIFVIDNAADIAIEYAGQGIDTVYTTTSYALNGGSEIETLTVTDHGLTTAINLTGNEYSNNLYGNNGVNALNGGGGNDAMIGYGGNDIFIVDNAADIAIEYAGQGIDTVYTTTSYTLNGGSEIETLTVSDHSLTNAINLTGNAYNNNIYGNNGANVLNGGGGNDAMIGYGGNDTFLVDSAADVAFEYAGQGVDTVYTTVTYTLNGGSEIERLSVNNHGATTAISLTGNTFNNEVLGNNGVNTLNGGGGNDTLAGFGGADIFAFTTAPGAGNVDLITDFLSGTDKIALENAVFTGLPAGPLAAGAFHTGAAAHDPDDRIIYNSATGALYFDADGNGSGAQVQFATLFGLPSLVAGDFTVI